MLSLAATLLVALVASNEIRGARLPAKRVKKHLKGKKKLSGFTWVEYACRPEELEMFQRMSPKEKAAFTRYAKETTYLLEKTYKDAAKAKE